MQTELREYLPWTARFHVVWMILLCSLTFGAMLVPLGVYLSFWARQKRRTGIALFLYAFLAVALPLSMIPDKFLPASIPWEDIGAVVAVVWVATGFVLRMEIKSCLRDSEGFDPEIKLLWTGLFSVLYINYCLSVLREGSSDRSSSILS